MAQAVARGSTDDPAVFAAYLKTLCRKTATGPRPLHPRTADDGLASERTVGLDPEATLVTRGPMAGSRPCGRSRARRRHSNADIRPSVVAGPRMSVAGRFRTFAGTRSGDKVRRLQTFPPSHRNQEVRPLRIFLTQVCGRLV